MITFRDELFFLRVIVLCFFYFFFGIGIDSVESVGQSEELDDTADHDDRYEYPYEHSLVKEYFTHDC